VKKSLNERKHFTQGRKVAEGAKKTKRLVLASLCDFASLREIVYFFTASRGRDADESGRHSGAPVRALQLQYTLRVAMGYFFQILGANRERVEKFTAGKVGSVGVVNRKQNVVRTRTPSAQRNGGMSK
jgi:hypothetical protein